MKYMRKLASLLLALALVLTLAATAFAADDETYTLTLKGAQEGHTYTAYQIFTGDLYEGILSNIVWGSGVTEAGQTALGNATAKAESLTTQADAEAFAAEVAAYLGTAAGSVTIATGADSGTISGLEAGYYLVMTTATTEENGAYTSYIMVVVEDTEATIKADVPKVEKKVKDTNDSVANSTTGWQDSADYDIGDDVPFQLTATLANNVSAYPTYKIIFHDTLSSGLTYNDDFKVVFNGVEVTDSFTDSYNEETGELTFTCNDVKAFGAGNSSVITVEYHAVLNEDAVIGMPGNPNEVYLEYSNNPNWNPGEGEDEEDSPTGNTPEDKVVVFTYQVIVNKVDEDQEPLAGAGFTLYKKNAEGEWDAIGAELPGDEKIVFTWTGLDDGDYKLVETTAPAGYNLIEDIFFTVEATHDETADAPVLEALVVKDADGNVISGENATFNVTLEKGEIETDVENKAGATLPETGGIGTTIFYILGGVLALAAVILLVTKKRMSSAE